MSNTYLPADVRTRIIDLMKERKVTQKKLFQVRRQPVLKQV